MTDEPEKPNFDHIEHAGTRNLLANKSPQWEKGQTGNPLGRPKGLRNRSTILREMLGLKMPGKKTNPLDPEDKDFTVEKGINVALINKALKGDVRAIQEIQDTMYGKNPDIVQGDPDSPIKHEHEHQGTIELKGDALKEELARRGLPTAIFDK